MHLRSDVIQVIEHVLHDKQIRRSTLTFVLSKTSFIYHELEFPGKNVTASIYLSIFISRTIKHELQALK